MKFAEHLGAHVRRTSKISSKLFSYGKFFWPMQITPEWRKQYIQYEEMKSMLYSALEQAPSAEVVEPEVRERFFRIFDEKFFTFCEKGQSLRGAQ